LISQGVFRF